MDAITICAANYLPFVNVLGSSFLESNKDSTFSVLVIDSEKSNFNKNQDFKYLSPTDLDIPENIFRNMSFYYNVTELATALKPSALKALFAQGSEKVIYLDPDIQVFSNLEELDLALDNKPIVLTPHTLNPIPRDGLRPTEADIMGSGTFNLGFLGLKNSVVATELLNWWEERLRFDSISDPLEMLFTDQRWIDLVPSYFPIFVLRHPGYNIAYWNLHERKLSSDEKGTQVNGEELRFFHFSGYRPDKPWILSKYVADRPRVVISKDPILAKLCEQYGEITKSFGWESENSIPYGYQNFENGKFIPSSLRRLYREDCIKAFSNGEILAPPDSWKDWATDRSIESGNLSRILFSIWKTRPDLKRRYPDATGTESEDLLNWARNHGIAEKVIDEEFLKIGNLINDVIPNKFSSKVGINVAGYLNGEFGLGQSSRLIYESSLKTGLPVSALNSNRSTSRQQEQIYEQLANELYPATIAIINADHFQFWVDDVGSEVLEKTAIIGVWAWETEDFPERMHSAFELVDEIWTVSNFVKDAISKETSKKVLVFPTPIRTPENLEKLNRVALGIPENKQYNLFIFDYMSIFNRKNPLGLVEAHIKAFPRGDGPLLIIKSTGGDNDAENREKLRFAVQSRKDILLIENYLSRQQLTALINECSTYISLHRSEGYGLTIAEAMALGKPVIATGYSGNMDFMNENVSFPIQFSLIKIGNGSLPYSPESVWAEPDLEQAAQIMNNLYRDKEQATKIGQLAKEHVTQSFNLDRAQRFIAERVTVNSSLAVRTKRKLSRKIQKVIKFLKRIKRIAKHT
jgi:glycosyltransferase involved in cell wall biosynthesis/lipopolysaccharide biosynthesis glycosyltransferase